MLNNQLQIGDQAPWFDAETLAETSHNLGVLGGRWIVLFFINSMSNAKAVRILAEIIGKLGRFFNDDHVVMFAVIGEAPPIEIASQFAEASHKGLGFMKDYDGRIGRLYQANGACELVVVDPLMRVAKKFSLEAEGPQADEIISYLSSLPSVDNAAGVPQNAPALIIPGVFEPEFCQELISLYEKNGGKDSGFMLDRDGKTMTVINHQLKQRQDFIITDEAVRDQIRSRVVKRVLPMMERFFSYRATRMDRYLVSCYDAETGGHFSRHRDNANAGARHRRFAASFNLNAGYEGCDLIFPEFGRRLYAAPPGGAILFATGALHQVTPITRGRRYAFVPFFYSEAEVRLRQENNANLHEGEGIYVGDRDELFPVEAG